MSNKLPDFTSEDKSYHEWVTVLKSKVQKAQVAAVASVNKELNLLYWDIGADILKKQAKQGWGAKVIDQLAVDLKLHFPDMKGFSSRNLKRMRKFAESYSDEQIVPQLVAQIPWGHNVLILEKIKPQDERLWYIQKTLENGWSRTVLHHQIESGLYQRVGCGSNNFKATLPDPQSDLALESIKDPYVFEFLGMQDNLKERELEGALIEHISSFLLELGSGFAYVGRQYNIDVGGKDFFIDLLFFHITLNCYIVIELKTGEFDPRDAGQLNFYLAAVDAQIKEPTHNPTIGLLLCKEKNHLVVEYALKNNQSPIGVSEYKLSTSIPEKLKGKLPTADQLASQLETIAIDNPSASDKNAE